MKNYPLPSSCCESTIFIHLSAWQTEIEGLQKKTYPVHQVPITPLKSTAFSISLLKLDPLIHADFCHKQKVSKGKSPGLPQMCFQQTHEDIWRFFSAETSSPTLRSRPWFRSWTTFLRKPEDGSFLIPQKHSCPKQFYGSDIFTAWNQYITIS